MYIMWILFQIKRHLAILYKDFILFFKKINLKNWNSRKVIKKSEVKKPEIEIKLDNKFYDFFSLDTVKIKPFYIKSPLFLIINQHKEEIFKNLLYLFSQMYDYRLKIGIEIEFYISNNSSDINIIKELKKFLLNGEILEKEEGRDQFEIKTQAYTDIAKLSNDYKNAIKTIEEFCKNNNLKFDINPIVDNNDCGNALQINLSLIDKDGKNLFSRDGNNESALMLNCIGGILKNINNNLLLYIKNNFCLERFNLERNREIFNGNKYPAPTFISWGINNRTAAIRIPTPSTTDIKKYMDEDKISRRIEFRVPSSSADIELVLIGVISSIIEGIEDDLKPNIEKSSYNILEKNDRLEAIGRNIENLNDRFAVTKDVLYFYF